MTDYLGKYPVDNDGNVESFDQVPQPADAIRLSNHYRLALAFSFLTATGAAALMFHPVREAVLQTAAKVINEPQLMNVIGNIVGRLTQ